MISPKMFLPKGFFWNFEIACVYTVLCPSIAKDNPHHSREVYPDEDEISVGFNFNKDHFHREDKEVTLRTGGHEETVQSV